MSVSAVVSFFKRFTVKFIEVVGAGIATAITGYLLAHFSGYWSSPAPAPSAIQASPNTSAVSKTQRAQPTPPVSADAKEQRRTPAQEVSPAAMQPARTTVNAIQAAAARKHISETSAADSKPRDEESVEAQVRAALANVDATRPAAPDVPLHQADIPPAPSAVVAPPRPAEGPLGGETVAATPRAADVQQSPIQSEPLPTVEIKSRPVAAVEPLPSAAPPPPAQENVQEEDSGLLSVIKKIPDLLRAASPAPTDEAPRPPQPVGQ
jgi:hypothetical protein